METAEPNKFYSLSWDEFHRDAKTLADQLRQTGTTWQGVLAVARGGLVPAAIVAHELGIRFIETVSVASYAVGSTDQEELRLMKSAPVVGDGKGWLVIDDLADTGRTTTFLRGMMSKAFFATVYAKPAGREAPDLFIKEFRQDTWLFFPWEIAFKKEDL